MWGPTLVLGFLPAPLATTAPMCEDYVGPPKGEQTAPIRPCGANAFAVRAALGPGRRQPRDSCVRTTEGALAGGGQVWESIPRNSWSLAHTTAGLCLPTALLRVLAGSGRVATCEPCSGDGPTGQGIAVCEGHLESTF